MKGATSSDSFSDAGSYESSCDDELRDGLGEYSDIEDEENSQDPNSDEEEGPTWTVEVWIRLNLEISPQIRRAFPATKILIMQGP